MAIKRPSNAGVVRRSRQTQEQDNLEADRTEQDQVDDREAASDHGTVRAGAGAGIGAKVKGKVSKYDPGHYKIPGTDHQGHSTRVWCRVQPSMDHALEMIVQSKNFPFGTKGDAVRWMIWEGIKRLEEMEPVPNCMLNVAEIMIETSRNAQFWDKFKTSLDATEHAVKMYQNSGNEQEAMKLVATCKALALKIPEDIWREQYLVELDKRFGSLFERHKSQGKKVKLTGR